MNEVTSSNGSIFLGKQGENLATRVAISIDGIKKVDGYPVLVHQRSKDAEPYPVAITETASTVVWAVTSADTEYSGRGRAELRWMGTNGEVIKSIVYQTYVVPSMAEPRDPPEAWDGYITKVAEDAQAAAQAAQEAAKAESIAVQSATQAREDAARAEKALKDLTELGTTFETDNTLTMKDGVLSVNTATEVEQDNTLPITSAAVATTVGNIDILLQTI